MNDIANVIEDLVSSVEKMAAEPIMEKLVTAPESLDEEPVDGSVTEEEDEQEPVKPVEELSNKSLTPLWEDFNFKPHQLFGVNWLKDRETSAPFGGILCDEMGLGKTIQIISLVKEDTLMKEPVTNNLLIAPVAVLMQWSDIAQKSGISVYQCGKKRTWEILGALRPAAPKLFIIGYESARLKPDLLMSKSWHRLICDEAHRLGSGKSCFPIIQKLECKHRWFLTATPIINSLKDLKNILELIGVKDAYQLTSNIEAIKPILSSIVLARTMEQLRVFNRDVPLPPEIQTIALPFKTEEEGDFYRGMTGGIVRRWKALETDKGPSGAPLLKLQLFLRLRQLSLHPQIYIQARREALGSGYTRPNWDGDSTKFVAIRKLIADDPGHKWIIFCHFHPEMSLLEQMLAKDPKMISSIAKYSGDLTFQQRKSVIDASHNALSHDKDSHVLLIQLQSGGVGLNLQHFDRIIFTGPWWTSALMEQAIGRAVRIGQRNIVKVYHLCLEEESTINIDKTITEKAKAKGELCRQVLANACSSIS